MTKWLDRDAAFRLAINALSMAVSAALVFWGGSPAAAVAGFLHLAAVAAVSARFELAHPAVWFAPVFALYTVSWPFDHIFREEAFAELDRRVMELHWLGLAAFLAVTLTWQGRARPRLAGLAPLLPWLKGLYWTALAGGAVYLILTAMEGVASKADIMASRRGLSYGTLQFFFFIQLAAYAGWLCAARCGSRRFPWMLAIGTGLFFVLAILVTGERQFFYRYVVISLLLAQAAHRKLSWTALLVLGALAAGLHPVMNQNKMALLDMDFRWSVKNWQRQVVTREFLSAPRNLHDILSEQAQLEPLGRWEYQHGRTLANAALRTVVLKPVINQLGGPDYEAPIDWFHKQFHPEAYKRGAGYGFTLVGEGYLNGGRAGAIAWFALLGALSMMFYRRAVRGGLWLPAYAMAIPTILFSIRGDYSMIFSFVFKYAFIPFLLVVLMREAWLGQWRWSRAKTALALTMAAMLAGNAAAALLPAAWTRIAVQTLENQRFGMDFDMDGHRYEKCGWQFWEDVYLWCPEGSVEFRLRVSKPEQFEKPMVFGITVTNPESGETIGSMTQAITTPAKISSLGAGFRRVEPGTYRFFITLMDEEDRGGRDGETVIHYHGYRVHGPEDTVEKTEG